MNLVARKNYAVGQVKMRSGLWIDGIQLAKYHVICAVGVDCDGHKHVLGMREGATENAGVAKASRRSSSNSSPSNR